MFVYLKSEKNLFTVGHYNPRGNWIPESDHSTKEDAANRVQLLNGKRLELFGEDRELRKQFSKIQHEFCGFPFSGTVRVDYIDSENDKIEDMLTTVISNLSRLASCIRGYVTVADADTAELDSLRKDIQAVRRIFGLGA